MRVVAGAIVEGGRVLAARRPEGKAHGGMWELPGGKVEPGESDAAALARELEEELGVRVVVGASLGVSRNDRIELVGYVVRLASGRPEAREHAELRWLAPAELGSVGWAPADLALIATLRTMVEAWRG